MMDLRWDNDIMIVNGDIAVVDEPDATGQRIKDRLRTFKGEWFLDRSFGPPYREQILVKNPRLEIIGAIIRSEIAKSASGTFVSFEASLNSTTRQLTVSTTLDTTFGQTQVNVTI